MSIISSHLSFEVRQSQAKQAEALHRIGGVHRSLEREVHVQELKHGLCLAHDAATLSGVEGACRGNELFERRRRTARRRASSRLTAHLGFRALGHAGSSFPSD
jgi:hypothetical protein